MNNKIVYLNITTWIGMSIGAVHYYGGLSCGGERFELTRKMTRADVIRANKIERGFGGMYYYRYRIGEKTHGFDDEDSIIECARKVWRTAFPDATILVLGRGTIADPQLILEGPEDYKNTVNKMYEEAERIGWYGGGQRERMNVISDEFQKLVKSEGLT